MVLEHLTNLPATKPLEEMTREELINYCKGKDALNKALLGALEIEMQNAQVCKEKYETLKKSSNIDFQIYRNALKELYRYKMINQIQEADIENLENQIEELQKIIAPKL